jgi:pilus assembly protein FimV
MLWLLVALVVLVIVAFALRVGLRRRREEAEVRSQPLKRAPEVSAPASSEDDAVAEARSAVADRPADLAAHLALLRTLAGDGREEEFGAALEAMFEHVSSGNEPEWREAVELAGRIVPGHPLVKGSADWVAEGAAEAEEPRSELDEESEVDDLMSRLDADLEESDDSDWLADESDEAEDRSVDRGPLLREDEPADEPRRERDRSGDEASIDFEPEPESESEPERGATDQDSDEDMVLDWPESPEDETGGERPAAEGAADESGEAGDGEDIFSQSDDDIDVKLDLAKAYLSWNSADSARTLLEEVVREGNEAQQEQARKLLDDLEGGSES